MGHIILGKVENNLGRYLIYCFHMPIFIAVSGFLINKKVLANMTFLDTVKKYFPRLLIPWGLAVIVYTTVVEYDHIFGAGLKEIGKLYLYAFLKPYYHLWFILGFLSYIFLTWFLLKLRLNNGILLVVAFVISVISKFELCQSNSAFITKLLDTAHYDFRIYNFIFFVLGMLLKEFLGKKQLSKGVLRFCAALSVTAGLACFCLFFLNFPTEKKLLYFILNIPLALWLLAGSYKDAFPRCHFLEYIGQNSMAFYLWHVLAKLAADTLAKGNVFSDILGRKGSYYLLCLILLALLYGLIQLLSRIDFINRYFFGTLQNKKV